MEHRWGRRIGVHIPIQLAGRGIPWKQALLANISVTGALIEAEFSFRVLSRIEVLVGSSRVVAFIARQHRRGVGVEWCELAPPAVTELLRAAAAPVPRVELAYAYIAPATTSAH